MLACCVKTHHWTGRLGVWRALQPKNISVLQDLAQGHLGKIFPKCLHKLYYKAAKCLDQMLWKKKRKEIPLKYLKMQCLAKTTFIIWIANALFAHLNMKEHKERQRKQNLQKKLFGKIWLVISNKICIWISGACGFIVEMRENVISNEYKLPVDKTSLKWRRMHCYKVLCFVKCFNGIFFFFIL